MLSDALLRWSWSNVLTKKRYDKIIERFGQLEAALPDAQLLEEIGCREDTVSRVLSRLAVFSPPAYREELIRKDIRCVHLEDSDYPAALRTIDDPPVFLYYKGLLDVLRQPCIALVGTREMSLYGKRVCEALVQDLIAARVVTVSGLAFGIDAEVARQTIRHQGQTVAVLGHGLGMIYPHEHAALAGEILGAGGLLLSEFPLDTAPDRFTFPARNRIIAGLSLATIVIEAALKSGSIITAELALEYNRDVFAVPGQIFDPQYEGCHLLIAEGRAKLARTAQDILIDCGIVAPSGAGRSYEPETDQESSILRFLSTMPMAVEDLLLKVDMDVATLTATLTILEMKGAVKNIGESKWVRAS